MTLENRIARLERQNRWMKRAGVGAVVLVGLFLTVGQSKPQDTIEARRFVVLDEDGEPHGIFGLGKHGATLELYEKCALRLQLTSQPSVYLVSRDHGNILSSVLKGPKFDGMGITIEGKSGTAMMTVTNRGSRVALTSLPDPRSNYSMLNVDKNGAGLTHGNKMGVVDTGAYFESGLQVKIVDPHDKILFHAP